MVHNWPDSAGVRSDFCHSLYRCFKSIDWLIKFWLSMINLRMWVEQAENRFKSSTVKAFRCRALSTARLVTAGETSSKEFG